MKQKVWFDAQVEGALNRILATLRGYYQMGQAEKAAALQQRLGISPEETMVFGDNINDIPMLKQAKYSYAVENARQECKDAANFDCPGWRENGVLQVLKQVSEGKVW